MEEIWKEIAISGYFISNLGKLRGRSGRIIKTYINKEGYCAVCLKPNGRKGKVKFVKIHRLVAEAFIPKLENKPLVNHIDGNKQNNVVTNLEWCTYKENAVHASKEGLLKPLCGTTNPKAKLTKQDIQYIKANYIPKHKKYGARALGRYFSVPHSTIIRILHGKRYKV